MNANFVFGIGNPLIDVTITATDEDLISLGINKGTMELVDEKRQKEIFDYFQSSEPRFNPGGSAPNTILACAALGAYSHISGKIGKDHFADIYLKRVNQYGADSGLVQGNGATGSSIILVTPDGRDQ